MTFRSNQTKMEVIYKDTLLSLEQSIFSEIQTNTIIYTQSTCFESKASTNLVKCSYNKIENFVLSCEENFAVSLKSNRAKRILYVIVASDLLENSIDSEELVTELVKESQLEYFGFNNKENFELVMELLRYFIVKFIKNNNDSQGYLRWFFKILERFKLRYFKNANLKSQFQNIFLEKLLQNIDFISPFLFKRLLILFRKVNLKNYLKLLHQFLKIYFKQEKNKKPLKKFIYFEHQNFSIKLENLPECFVIIAKICRQVKYFTKEQEFTDISFDLKTFFLNLDKTQNKYLKNQQVLNNLTKLSLLFFNKTLCGYNEMVLITDMLLQVGCKDKHFRSIFEQLDYSNFESFLTLLQFLSVLKKFKKSEKQVNILQSIKKNHKESEPEFDIDSFIDFVNVKLNYFIKNYKKNLKKNQRSSINEFIVSNKNLVAFYYILPNFLMKIKTLKEAIKRFYLELNKEKICDFKIFLENPFLGYYFKKFAPKKQWIKIEASFIKQQILDDYKTLKLTQFLFKKTLNKLEKKIEKFEGNKPIKTPSKYLKRLMILDITFTENNTHKFINKNIAEKKGIKVIKFFYLLNYLNSVNSNKEIANMIKQIVDRNDNYSEWASNNIFNIQLWRFINSMKHLNNRYKYFEELLDKMFRTKITSILLSREMKNIIAKEIWHISQTFKNFYFLENIVNDLLKIDVEYSQDFFILEKLIKIQNTICQSHIIEIESFLPIGARPINLKFSNTIDTSITKNLYKLIILYLFWPKSLDERQKKIYTKIYGQCHKYVEIENLESIIKIHDKLFNNYLTKKIKKIKENTFNFFLEFEPKNMLEFNAQEFVIQKLLPKSHMNRSDFRSKLQEMKKYSFKIFLLKELSNWSLFFENSVNEQERLKKFINFINSNKNNFFKKDETEALKKLQLKTKNYNDSMKLVKKNQHISNFLFDAIFTTYRKSKQNDSKDFVFLFQKAEDKLKKCIRQISFHWTRYYLRDCEDNNITWLIDLNFTNEKIESLKNTKLLEREVDLILEFVRYDTQFIKGKGFWELSFYVRTFTSTSCI